MSKFGPLFHGHAGRRGDGIAKPRSRTLRKNTKTFSSCSLSHTVLGCRSVDAVEDVDICRSSECCG